MSISDSPLFRREAMRHRADRLHGNVSLATPLAWQAIGFLLLIVLAVAVGFLAFASYGRVETVAGEVMLDKGVATIMPSRAGVIICPPTAAAGLAIAGTKEMVAVLWAITG